MRLPVFGFGAWRLYLASLVAASHLWEGMAHGYAAYAVWGFFVLSGFLMTFVLTTKYGFDRVGLTTYAFNRFMRIIPLYWLAVLMGLGTLWYAARHGIDLRQINPQFYLPSSVEGWLHVATLFPGFSFNGLPVPVSNALAIEVGYYMLLPLMAQSRAAAWLGAAFGAMIALHMGITLDSFAPRYATFLPCALAFSTGALVCHYRDALARLSMPWTSVLVWTAHGFIWFKVSTWPWLWGLYVSMLLSAWVVISLYRLRTGQGDRLLGDLSYPVYLVHTTVGAWFICPCGFTRSGAFALKAFALTLLLSWLIVVLVDRPLSRLKWRPPRDPGAPGAAAPD